MADSPINLNRARKARARLNKKTQASENAVKFGLTKSEKMRMNLEKQKSEQHLSAHLRTSKPDDPS